MWLPVSMTNMVRPDGRPQTAQPLRQEDRSSPGPSTDPCHRPQSSGCRRERKHNVGEVRGRRWGCVIKLCHRTLVHVLVTAFKMGLVLGFREQQLDPP